MIFSSFRSQQRGGFLSGFASEILGSSELSRAWLACDPSQSTSAETTDTVCSLTGWILTLASRHGPCVSPVAGPGPMTSHSSISPVSVCLWLQDKSVNESRRVGQLALVAAQQLKASNDPRRCCLLPSPDNALPAAPPPICATTGGVVGEGKMRATLGLQPDDIAVQGAPGSHGPANTGAKSPLFPLRLNFARRRVLIGARRDRTARSGKWLGGLRAPDWTPAAILNFFAARGRGRCSSLREEGELLCTKWVVTACLV